MARKAAFGGILTAISVLLVYFGTVMPTGRLSVYSLSSIPVALAIIEFGPVSGLLVYFATTLLSAMLIGNILGISPYVFFFGIYGVIKFYIQKSRSFIKEITLKLLTFNIMLFSALRLGESIFGNITNGRISIALLVLPAQIVFLIYDYIFSRIIWYYEDKIKFFT